MSDSTSPQSASTDDLQFDKAEAGDSQSSGAGAGPTCARCRQPIASSYFALGDQLLCPACREVAIAPLSGSRSGRLVKATMLGVVAGLVGAVIWFAIRRIAQVEIGLVAILVGFLVGKAVHRGSGGRGGRGYQVLAVVITYCSICANYMPDVIEGFIKGVRERQAANAKASPGPAEKAPGEAADPVAGAPAAPAEEPTAGKAIVALAMLVGLVFAVSLAAPFLGGASNVIGLLIIGFALWEAWKFNARRQLPITGPYQMGSSPAG